MNRRQFLFSALLPLFFPIDSHAFSQFFVRGLLRYAFRALVRRSFSRFSVRMVSRSMRRTSRRIYRPNRIRRIFGNRKYNILGKNGRVLGTGRIEAEVMVLRNAQGRMLGYIQSENRGLAVYDGAGNRVILFKKENGRVIAYNKDEDYLGQIIEEMVGDQIKSYFIDRNGVKHDSIPVEFREKEQSFVITEHNTRIKDGKLEILDDKNEVIMRGIYRDDGIALYDLDEKLVAIIKRQDGILSVYDSKGELMHSSNSSDEFISISH